MDERGEHRHKPSITEEWYRERDQPSQADYQRRRKNMERETEQHERLEWEGAPQDQPELPADDDALPA